jgi:hypothetical protein
MTRTRDTRRAGATIVEGALVLPVMFLLLFGIIVLGHGVFRYQMVTCQAREVARWAAVRGSDYQGDTGKPSPTAREIKQAVIHDRHLAAGMDPNGIRVRIEWCDQALPPDDPNRYKPWDESPKYVRSIKDDPGTTGLLDGGQYISNTVRVTVSYPWAPGVFMDPVELMSVCELPMLR